MRCPECHQHHGYGGCSGYSVFGEKLTVTRTRGRAMPESDTENLSARVDKLRMNVAAGYSHLSVEGDDLYLIVKLKLDPTEDTINELNRMDPRECLRYAIDIQE